MEIRIEHLQKHYSDRCILDIPAFRVPEGSFYALAGPNGSGKTTLLRILALLDRDFQGTLWMDGVQVHSGNAGKTDIQKYITLVHQTPYMFHTTVERNVGFGLRCRGIGKEEIRRRVSEALAMVGLEGFEKKRAVHLSGGETQRVALARGLVLQSRLLLLDEPTANVDSTSVEMLEEVLSRIHRQYGVTIILSTHDLRQAARLAEETFLLTNGRLTEADRENTFRGTIRMVDGEPVLDTGNLSIKLPSADSAYRRISIRPNEIIVSKRPLVSSARNCLPGVIREICAKGEFIQLRVDAGEPFLVAITARSYQEMDLHLLDTVYLSFKSTSISPLYE